MRGRAASDRVRRASWRAPAPRVRSPRGTAGASPSAVSELPRLLASTASRQIEALLGDDPQAVELFADAVNPMFAKRAAKRPDLLGRLAGVGDRAGDHVDDSGHHGAGHRAAGAAAILDVLLDGLGQSVERIGQRFRGVIDRAANLHPDGLPRHRFARPIRSGRVFRNRHHFASWLGLRLRLRLLGSRRVRACTWRLSGLARVVRLLGCWRLTRAPTLIRSTGPRRLGIVADAEPDFADVPALVVNALGHVVLAARLDEPPVALSRFS